MVEKKQPGIPRPMTQKRLMNIALYYLGRYESSASRLRQFLKKRIIKEKSKGAEIPEEIENIITDIISKVCEFGYVNDERYALSLVKRLRQSGKSARYISEKLRQAGISKELQQEIMSSGDAEIPEAELDAARRFVQKKKLGHLRPVEKRQENRKKDLASLARAGFSFEIAVKALGQSDEEEEYYNV